MDRRAFLKRLTMVGSALLLLPKTVLAMVWKQTAFQQTRLDETLAALGIPQAKTSADIYLDAPDRAENGAIVQVEIKSKLADTQSITLLVEKNPTPLIATYHFSPSVVGHVITRIKMADTSDVIAIVKAGEHYYQQRKNVVVLESGCGD